MFINLAVNLIGENKSFVSEPHRFLLVFIKQLQEILEESFGNMKLLFRTWKTHKKDLFFSPIYISAKVIEKIHIHAIKLIFTSCISNVA